MFACEVYLFGSAIYEGGDQFDPQQSDLDLVVRFHDDLVATARTKRLQKLQAHKAALELRMLPVLHRTDCVEPGVSVLPITTLELHTNIHKGKSRHFFTQNVFLDLLRSRVEYSIPGAGGRTLPDEARKALELAQEIRNQYLAISANGTGGLTAFNGQDPIPKGLARTAAQLVPENYSQPVAEGPLAARIADECAKPYKPDPSDAQYRNEVLAIQQRTLYSYALLAFTTDIRERILQLRRKRAILLCR